MAGDARFVPRYGASRSYRRRVYWFRSRACLINRYRPGAQLSLHQDRSEKDMRYPVVTISIGLPAVFLLGGMTDRNRWRTAAFALLTAMSWCGAAQIACAFTGSESWKTASTQ